MTTLEKDMLELADKDLAKDLMRTKMQELIRNIRAEGMLERTTLPVAMFRWAYTITTAREGGILQLPVRKFGRELRLS